MNGLEEKTLETTAVFDGVLLRVRRDRVRLPDGRPSVREWIDHPGAAAVVPLFEDGGTLLVRQFRYAPRRTFLEVPAGKLDVAGEGPEAVAARELREETGYRAGRLTRLAALNPCIGYSNEVIHFFLAEELTEGARDLSDGEFIELVPMSFTEAVDRAKRGELQDMKTVAGLMLAEAFLARRMGRDA